MSESLIYGTLMFIVLGAAVFLSLMAYVRSISKANRVGMNVRITAVSVLIGTFCMWLMWICTYMHQMHPLIKPAIINKST